MAQNILWYMRQPPVLQKAVAKITTSRKSNLKLNSVCWGSINAWYLSLSVHISISIYLYYFFFWLAIQDYETAKEHSENDQQILEGLEKAQKMLKQSQKRDYYKILGVKR